MGNIIGSFDSSLSKIISWLSDATKFKRLVIEEPPPPLPIGCTPVRDFLHEYEQDLCFVLGPHSHKYHYGEGYILQKLIVQLEQELNFLAGERLIVVPELTLFHVVCLAKQPFLVEKYLKQGVQVNQAIGAAFTGQYAGCSPLHLALSEIEFLDGEHDDRFSTIHILLEFGADVNSRNCDGNTPLHVLFSLNGPLDQRLFKLIVDNGADDNATNQRGETPFEVLIASHPLLDIEAYIKSGGNINHFNSENHKGCIAMMMINNRVSTTTVNDSSSIMKIDSHQSRTALHNNVSFEAGGRNPSYIEFQQHKIPKIIEYYLKMGGRIDCQDILGKTPLQYAVDFHNARTVSMLLTFGSDVNRMKVSGRSALS